MPHQSTAHPSCSSPAEPAEPGTINGLELAHADGHVELLAPDSDGRYVLDLPVAPGPTWAPRS